MGNNKSTVAGNFITLIFGRINVSVVIIVTTLEKLKMFIQMFMDVEFENLHP